ncbi:bacterial alpha-L-rhamnosidase-domain-containing protein [Aspergillus venezuelensis]
MSVHATDDDLWEARATWIWLPNFDDTRNPGAVVLFRKAFDLQDIPHSFIIRVTADSRYKLRVNGQVASIGPCKGTVDHWYYETVDVAHLLQQGENVIAAEVLRYAPVHRGNVSVTRSYSPGFILLGESEETTIASDASWRCIEDRSITFVGESPLDYFLSVNETVDGLLRTWGWEDVGFDDSSWEPPVTLVNAAPTDEVTTLPWNLKPRDIPPLTTIPKQLHEALIVRCAEPSDSFEIQTLESTWNALVQDSQAVHIPANSRVVVDLAAPEYSTGYLNFETARGRGAVVRLLCAESYEYGERPSHPIPDVYVKGDRTDFNKGILNGIWDTYYIAGRENEVYQTWWWRTFRFLRVEITTKEEALTLAYLGYTETNYPLEVKADFTCSNKQYQKFWEISLRTLKNCMHETYEDCPFYEQTQFPFDTRSQILFTYIVSGDDRLARKAIHDMHCSLRPDGLLAMRSPAHMNHILPVFSLSFIQMIADHILFYGDKAFAQRYVPTCEAIIAHFERLVRPDGLVGRFDRRAWSYVDWVEGWTFGTPPAARVGPATYFSLAYAIALEAMADISRFVSRNELARAYEERKAAVISAVNALCYDGTFYLDGPVSSYRETPGSISEHCQVYAVLAGAIEGEDAQRLLARMVDAKDIHKASYVQSLYKFRAFHKADMYTQTAKLWSAWDEMVVQNLDTWAEMPFNARSDCHAWSAVPLVEFPCGILGIQPTAPRCATVEIRPVLEMAKAIKGSLATPRGLVTVTWSPLTDSRVHFRIELPRATRAIVVFPSGETRTFEDEGLVETEVGI